MRRLIVAVLLALILSGGVSWVWASCSAMRSYRVSRPEFAFSYGPSPAEIMAARAAAIAARARARELRRQKTLDRIEALSSRDEQLRLLTQEKRRDRLEEQFARAYQQSAQERLRQAEELYEKGRGAESRRNIDVAKDYYLFAMQLAPGTKVAVQAHAALKRLDADEKKTGNDARAMNSTSLLTQRDLDEIRQAAGAAFAEDEGVQQMLDSLANEEDERKRRLIIERLRDEKGAAFSDGLVQAIAMLPTDAKQPAREALVERFTRLTPPSLRAKLTADTESRLAAIKAVAVKKSTELAPDLANLLTDKDATQRQAALAALKQITGQDFGPAPNAGFAEQFVAQKKWKEWLSRK